MAEIQNKILVTGGAGFIGSNLCQYLLDKGHIVYCIDNLTTGNKKNIEHLSDNKNFSFFFADVTRPMQADVEQVYNLASPASPVQYRKDPTETIKTNLFGSINVLEFAKHFKVKVLQASTSEIYGDPAEHPQKETYNGNVSTRGDRACYDESKRCAETLFFNYSSQFKVDIKIVRIFNTYGKNMALDDGRVISNFIVQALRNEDITVYNYGKQTRSFCYVDDLVEGLYKMMNNEKVKLVNLGNPEEITIKELAEKIIKLTGSKSKIKYDFSPFSDDPCRRNPDISLAKKHLDWKPKINLDEGLKRTIEYFKKII